MAITTWTAKWGQSLSDFAELTPDNVDFVNDAIVWEPGFKLDVHCDPKGIEYWFDKLAHCRSSDLLIASGPSEYLKKAIERIDVNNSMHLETCVNGRREMYKRICHLCTTIGDLEKKVKAAIARNGTCLFFALLEPLKLKGATPTADRINISFASKFIFYARKYLCGMANPDFSIYDKVVRERLAWYVDKYSPGTLKGKKLTKSSYDIRVRSQLDAYDAYTNYSDHIGAVIASVTGKAFHPTREDFDHLVWFTSR